MAVSKALRERIIERDGAICAKCGTTDRLQIDHIEPVAAGGTDDEGNLQVLCRLCNLRKGDGGHYARAYPLCKKFGCSRRVKDGTHCWQHTPGYIKPNASGQVFSIYFPAGAVETLEYLQACWDDLSRAQVVARALLEAAQREGIEREDS